MDDNSRYGLLQHRYYGDSVPFGSKDEAFSNTSTLGYFTSTQALADYAELITNLKKNLSAENCPVIAIGGSYGGMLASWFRLKYPHIVIGALASSAPILYFDDITPGNAYHVIVTKDFRETSESCYSTIRDSWSEIDKVAAEPNGLANLSQIFMTCEPLNSSQELKYYLALCYVVSAQNDNPPAYPVKKVCDAIDGAPEGTDIIGRVAAGLNASVGPPCHFVYDFKPSNRSEWTWQVFIVIYLYIFSCSYFHPPRPHLHYHHHLHHCKNEALSFCNYLLLFSFTEFFCLKDMYRDGDANWTWG
ncbi:hypothetical protein VitviT2T_008987 [Vitis vinifera]|uniref:Lysosomal Pro-X carboxypeptidase n=1 Tax=Vitis vinifera TaxID=29760 RepID=A0ABY9C480_VITVI|nr:hypothetical protein VitviT2T_008987 [Vitis vinifera]